MSRLMQTSGLRFSQLRYLSAKARKTQATTNATVKRKYEEKHDEEHSDTIEVVRSLQSGSSRSQDEGVVESLSPHDNSYITALLDAFITLGMASEAEQIFNRYRREGYKFSVSIYNKMLECWVKKGINLRAVMLYETMRRDNVEYTAQTYAIMLVLHTRHKNWESARKIITQMESKGYLLKHIFQTAQLSKSEATDILKAMEYFGVSVETKPCNSAPYPRVVRDLYDDWIGERKGGRIGREDEEMERFQGKTEIRQCLERPLFTTAELKDRLRRQLQIEQQGYLSVPSIAAVHKSDDQEEEALKESTHRLMRQWHRDLTSTIKRDTEDFRTIVNHLPALGSKFFGPKQYPFLALLPEEVWADIVVEEVVVHILGQQQGLPVTYICRLISESAWHKYVVLQKRERGVVEKTNTLYHQFMDHLCSPSSHNIPYRQLWQYMDESLCSAGSLSVDIPKWPFTVGSYVGTGLLSRLMDTAKLNPNNSSEPAFYHSYETGDNGWPVGHIKAHKKLFKLFRKYYIKHESTHFRVAAELSPMLIPPRPWSHVNEGGYFVNPVSIMRSAADVYQHHSLLLQAPNLNAVFDSLNVLGTCPWKINSKVLDLVTEIFNNGGCEELGVPVRDPILPQWLESQEPSRRKEAQMKKLRNECYSLWMDMLYRLSLANYFRDELFWMPHNMDFRGRVYPVPPHLSHLTSDVGRAVLQFGAGYPLGERGLDWLKIHLVNLHGHKKKVSLEKRVEYADEMMQYIMDSADNPMNGNKWWQSGDDPWQVLACCMEVTAAIRSGDPVNYISHLPIHQDGSCNGLQHYAALGRDWLGAKQVNLTPGDAPQDPYAGVAAMVEEQRKRDATEGHEIALKLEGKISRKVVKQTVMTVVYGVTWVGGRLQIAKQLRGTIPDDQLWDCSAYVVGEVFRALRLSFANARGIQDWLSAGARKVSLAHRPMEWVTPLGLPVIQPYHKIYHKTVQTQLQGLNMRIGCNPSYPPDTRKQKNAMPPNFVHSLDSTHMMLTALHAHRAGISFVAVHDSYWTHACFVDTMNTICRQQFVTLHNEPILSDLAQFLEKKFGNLTYKDNTLKGNKFQKCEFRDPFPTIGDFDLNQVLNSTYFFS